MRLLLKSEPKTIAHFVVCFVVKLSTAAPPSFRLPQLCQSALKNYVFFLLLNCAIRADFGNFYDIGNIFMIFIVIGQYDYNWT